MAWRNAAPAGLRKTLDNPGPAPTKQVPQKCFAVLRREPAAKQESRPAIRWLANEGLPGRHGAAGPRADDPAPASNAGPLASAASWTFVADGYDESTRPFLETFSRSVLERLHLGPRSDVIDIACGPGTTALLLSPRVRHVACVDFSEGMLRRLRRHIDRAGASNIEPCRADGQALPFAHASFDVGLSMFGLMFFPDRAKGFGELHRVLRPGGEAAVSSWAPAGQSPLLRLVVEALGEPPAESPPAAPGLENPAVLEREMTEAGFMDVRVEPVSHAMTVTDVESFWHGMVRGVAPIALLKHKASPRQWARTEAAAKAHIAGALPELPALLPSVAYLAVGRKP
uniref:class I SAM-dependent methyltransferase n=1 Tax=Mesorhizobium sp. L-8-3 TaxID=2744522 RepID=UPI001FD51ECA|nr:class I SAM-dependent methyltransferase [Mesorhizobium sp. L-8-3]